MIRGVGIDIVDVARIQSLQDRYGQRFLTRVFTDGEIAYCEKKHNMIYHLSARLAAKEAAVKALGTGIMDGIGFKDIEVVKDNGPPRIELFGGAKYRARELGVSRIHLSISHDGGLAVAVVIMESDK